MRPSLDLAQAARRATLAELLTLQSVPSITTPGPTYTHARKTAVSSHAVSLNTVHQLTKTFHKNQHSIDADVTVVTEDGHAHAEEALVLAIVYLIYNLCVGLDLFATVHCV